MDRNAGRMDLRETGIGEISASLIALKGGGTVGIHSVGGKEIGISISSGGNDDGMRAEALELAGDEIAGDDTLGLAVHKYEVEHLVTGITLHRTGGNLAVKGGISTEKELLSGLSASIESTADLDASERTVSKIAAILAGERNTLGDALVDDGRTYFSQTIDVGFAGAVISALDSIIKKPVDGVVVVLIILGGIDTSLGGNGVCTTGRVADTEDLDIVPELTEGSGCRRASEAGAYYYDLEFPFIVGTDKMNF